MSDTPATVQTPRYIQLTMKTSFSLLESMVPVKKLGKDAEKRQLVALGVTEVGNLFSAVELSKYVGGAGVQPVLGCELPVWLPKEPLDHRPRQVGYLTLLVQDETGWANVARLISAANQTKYASVDGAYAVELDAVLAADAGLIALSGPYGRGLLDGWRRCKTAESGDEAQLIGRLKAAFGDRLYVQVERHYIAAERQWESFVVGDTTYEAAARRESETEAWVTALAEAQGLPLVATNDTRFLKAKDLEAFEVLIGIGDSTTMDDARRRRFCKNHCLRDEADMLRAFADLPAALENSVQIAQRCAYLLPAVSVKQMYMPKWEFSPGEDTDDVLRREAGEGLKRRMVDYVYPWVESKCDNEAAKAAARAAADEQYSKQLDFEINVITGMGFPGYFLITSDFIRWAKANGIPVGPGRGSGAGSLVAWSLEITDLDPIRWELYFERFLNPDRVSLPDFDVDFCQDRREEVIAYVRQRFGADRVSQIITFGTLNAKACLRDVGRVLGLPYGFVSQVAAFIPEVAVPPKISEVLESDERLKARYDEEEDVKRLVDTAMELEGCYRHASTHAAGVIIADRPIDAVCGLYVDPRSEMPATQLAMGDAEYAGLVKFDFLGLKTLSVVRMAEHLVHGKGERNSVAEDAALDISKIDLADPAVFAMLKKGITCGVFQIEGAGITELTKKMQADDMESLSAILALYRPGPLGTGMVDDYINRKLGRADAEYPHDILKPALEVTYGVPVYQEQIMQMARDMAGYTLGGADMLRRAMGKKKAEEMAKERAKFVTGAAELHQVPADEANAIFDLMDKFSGYGFNKAHTIAYALISYQTAWLKAHHPLEFLASTMSYDRGNTEKLLRYKQDTQKLGFGLRAPDVNLSGVFFTVETDAQEGQPNGAVRHALAALKGAGEDAMRALVAERDKGGAYTDIWNLLCRLGPQVMNKRQLEVLAKSGALDPLAHGDKDFRARVLGNLERLQAYGAACAEARSSGQDNLFGGGAEVGTLDPSPFKAAMQPPLEVDHLTRLAYEQQAIGFYLNSHPLEAFEEELAKIKGIKPLMELETFAGEGGGQCKVTGIVLGVREVKTKKGDRMGVVTLSDPTGQAEVAFFPEAYAQHAAMLSGGAPLMLTLKVQQDGERLRINSETLRTLESVLGERSEIFLELGEEARDALVAKMILARVQRVLNEGKGGLTRVRLKVPGQQGQVWVRLPDGYRLDTRVLSNLRGIDGLVLN